MQYLGNDAKIVLPENYKGGSYVIGAEAFYNNTSITSVEIPNSVTSIGTYAFYNCNNVESLYIGNSIQQIGDYAFEGCNNLFDIKVANKKVITISDNVFSVDSYNNAVLYVPTGRSTVYKNRTPWNKFIVIEEIDFDKIEITGISLYKETLALIEGETETLTATIKPSYATDQTVTWTSDNEEVATVDGGVVTAVKAGTATITATAGGYSVSCVVTVEAAVHPITSLAELSNTAVYYICQLNHSSGETSWAVATNGNALKSNKDLNIATDMNDTRQQFAILSIDGGATRYLYHVATQKFVNKDGSLSTTPADAISFMNGAYDNTFFAYFDGSHNVNVGGSQEMIINGWNTPDGGNSCSIIPVGEFDSTGELNKLLDITVTKITLNEIDITLTEGENFTLTATLTPDDVSDAFVIWTTSNSHIATVERGVVTAIKPGRAAITATAGDYSASCVVTVEAAVYPITSLAELSNSGVYYICQANHSKGATSWAVATNGNALKSNKDLNIATDMNDTRQQFAVLSIDGGVTRYLYHVATKKFVNKDGSLSTTPADAISFMNGAYDNTFFAYFDGSHYVNVGGNKQMIIDGWNTPDGGNSCSITPVGEFDSAAALKAINDLATGIEEVKGENGEVKAVYDLQGRKVENPTTGIYIINGKMVLVK